MKKYFLVKSKIECLNEKGKVVKLSEQNLVQALDVKDAESVFRMAIKDTILEGSDITSISETKIIDVFNYAVAVDKTSNDGDKSAAITCKVNGADISIVNVDFEVK